MSEILLALEAAAPELIRLVAGLPCADQALGAVQQAFELGYAARAAVEEGTHGDDSARAV